MELRSSLIWEGVWSTFHMLTGFHTSLASDYRGVMPRKATR